MTSSIRKMRLLLKDCAAGFYQQMYFLGKDVSHPNGNLLTEYGFLKSPSTGLTGTSCYTYATEKNLEVELYGACAAIYTDESKLVFLRERCRFYEWLPEYKLVAGRWTQDDLQINNPYIMFNTLVPLLEWWVKYEEWINVKMGSNHREQCYKEWKKLKSKPAWLSPERALLWVSDFLLKEEKHLRPKHFS